MDVGQTGGLQKRDSEWAYYLSSLYCICWQYNMLVWHAHVIYVCVIARSRV